MSFKFGDYNEVLTNRKSFLNKLEIPLNECVVISAQHSDEVVIVNKSEKGRGTTDFDSAVSVDGCICSQERIFLVLLVADCLPIIMFDKSRCVVALLHAGWKSTDRHIAELGVIKMVDEFQCNPADIVVALGPCIKKESYKFKNPVQKDLEGWEPFLQKYKDGKTMIDIVGYNVHQLMNAGIVQTNITVSGIDTATDKRFFSHYRDQVQDPDHEGRFACVVGIKNSE